MAKLLDGKKVSGDIITRVAVKVRENKADIFLAVVLVGNDSASQIYVKKKEEACKKAGIASIKRVMPQDTSEEKLLKLIEGLNANPMVTGILVQFPLPKHIDEGKICAAISPEKDVDCCTPENLGKFYSGNFSLAPCTPKGIMALLDEYLVPLDGKNVTVIGRSNTVGKPLAFMLIGRNATVTIAHSKTKDLEECTKNADLVVVAVGKKGLLKGGMVKEGCIVVDVGINREKGKIYGDVEFESVSKKASYITPVPGGVGPMTIAGLLQNTYYLHEKKKGK